jgi:hypothetical protein
MFLSVTAFKLLQKEKKLSVFTDELESVFMPRHPPESLQNISNSNATGHLHSDRLWRGNIAAYG